MSIIESDTARQILKTIASKAVDSVGKKINKWLKKKMPGLASFDDRVGNTIKSVCGNITGKLLASVHTGFYDADIICNRGNITSFKDYAKRGLELAIYTGLTLTASQLFLLFNRYILQNVASQIAGLVTNLISIIMEILDAVCGLIPEVGGFICSVFTVPLTAAGNWIVDLVVSESTMALFDEVQDKLMSYIKDFSRDLAEKVVDKIVDAVDDIVGSTFDIDDSLNMVFTELNKYPILGEISVWVLKRALKVFFQAF